MRSIAYAALAAFLLATHGGANAEPGQPRETASATQAVSQQDIDNRDAFARDASVVGQFDLQSAQLALDRAKKADVRSLAREIVEDQTLANSRLQAFAPKDFQTQLDSTYAAELKKLKDAKAEDFDTAFLAAQQMSHTRSVPLYTAYTQRGTDRELKAYASETLSFLTLHQSRVKSLQ